MEEGPGHGRKKRVPTPQTQERVEKRVLDIEDGSILSSKPLRRERLDGHRGIRAGQLDA